MSGALGRAADHPAVHPIVLRPGGYRALRASAARAARHPALGDRRLGAAESPGPVLQPRSASELVATMDELASPIAAFLRDRCVVEPDAICPVAAIYEAWRSWCQEHGRERSATSTRSAATCTRPFPASPPSGPELRWAACASTRVSASAPPSTPTPMQEPTPLLHRCWAHNADSSKVGHSTIGGCCHDWFLYLADREFWL